MPILPEARKPVIVYTDASAEGDRVRIGAMVIPREGPIEVIVYDPPPEVIKRWGAQDAIVNQAELHAAPIVACTVPETLRGEDVIWFIDNAAAESALVKAGSPTQTMCKIALVATAALAAVRARTWYEHVKSEDNPADVLSRAGLEDFAVQAAIKAGKYVVRQPVEPPEEAKLDYSYWWRRSSDMDAPGAAQEMREERGRGGDSPIPAGLGLSRG